MKRGTTGFILGLITGAVIFGGSAAYAASVMANPATNSIIVDGSEISVKAYIIEGRNYLQLRDIAAAVGFSVVWDGENNQVLIDTTRGYDPNEQMPAAQTASAMTIDEMKMEIVRLTNAERVKAGIPELTVLPELMDCAQAKADDMLENHYYGHNSPVYGTPGEMMRSFIPNSKGWGENIAPWTKTPAEAFAGWVDSPDHYRNITNSRYTHIGVGIIVGADGGYWWIEQFCTL